MLISPGVTSLPLRVEHFAARLAGMFAATAAIFPPAMATSSSPFSFCEGSMTRPPLISRS